MWISVMESNPWMMERCSFEALWIVLVCQVHISVLSQDVSRFIKKTLVNSTIRPEALETSEAVHLFCLASSIPSLLCFSDFSFLIENELLLSPYIFLSNFSFLVKNCFKGKRTSTQLNSESVVSKDHKETLKSYLS